MFGWRRCAYATCGPATSSAANTTDPARLRPTPPVTARLCPSPSAPLGNHPPQPPLPFPHLHPPPHHPFRRLPHPRPHLLLHRLPPLRLPTHVPSMLLRT